MDINMKEEIFSSILEGLTAYFKALVEIQNIALILFCFVALLFLAIIIEVMEIMARKEKIKNGTRNSTTR